MQPLAFPRRSAGGWQRWFFIVLATVSQRVHCCLALAHSQCEGPLVLTAGLSLVLGGAVGNLVDRVRLGYVTDFIQVWFGSWAFPSFNVADAAITVGAAFLIIDAIFYSGKAEGELARSRPAVDVRC